MTCAGMVAKRTVDTLNALMRARPEADDNATAVITRCVRPDSRASVACASAACS